MQVRLEALDAALARGLPVLAWVHGDEPLLVIEAADAIRARARALGYVEREAFSVDRSFSVQALLAQAGTMSLFASRRLVELRLNGKPTRELGEALAALARGLGEDTRVLVSGPRLDRAATESAWFAQLDGEALVVPVYPVERARLGAWIAARLARQGQRLDAGSLAFVADRVEGNLLAAHQEILKLGLLFDRGELPPDAVRSAVLDVARYDAFTLAEATFAGDAPRALRTVDGLAAEGQAAPFVLWALAEALRNLWRLSVARDRGEDPQRMMRPLRIFAAREAPYRAGLKRLRTQQIERAMRDAAMIDRMAKGVADGDPWDAIRRLVAALAGGPEFARP